MTGPLRRNWGRFTETCKFAADEALFIEGIRLLACPAAMGERSG
jgi:hypothetical protein